jgi:hypothetical protein
MLDEMLDPWLRWWGGTPCFRIYGKTRTEITWRIIDVFGTARRDRHSRWPLWRGACTTWSAEVIAVGWDFARAVIREQAERPVSPHHPLEVEGGRLWRPARQFSAGEILAHEIGHTWQALRLGPFYLPLVGAVTLFREGPHPWNRFENEASALGQYGGLVPGSVCAALRDNQAR